MVLNLGNYYHDLGIEGSFEMKQSEIFKTIVEGLNVFGVSENCALCIMELLETEEQLSAMLEWIMEVVLDEERTPTEQDCLTEAVMITKKIPKNTLDS